MQSVSIMGSFGNSIKSAQSWKAREPAKAMKNAGDEAEIAYANT
jgi:hypothetical protein